MQEDEGGRSEPIRKMLSDPDCQKGTPVGNLRRVSPVPPPPTNQTSQPASQVPQPAGSTQAGTSSTSASDNGKK